MQIFEISFHIPLNQSKILLIIANILTYLLVISTLTTISLLLFNILILPDFYYFLGDKMINRKWVTTSVVCQLLPRDLFQIQKTISFQKYVEYLLIKLNSIFFHELFLFLLQYCSFYIFLCRNNNMGSKTWSNCCQFFVSA